MQLPSTRRAGMAVFALALAVRLAFVAAVPGWGLTRADLYDDAPDFHEIAVHVAAGDGYVKPWVRADPAETRLRPTAFRAPLWPVALAAVYRVTGPSPFAGRLLNVVIDALTCALLVVVGTRLRDRRTGIIAGVLAAVYLPLLVGVTQLMSEPVFTLAVVLVLLAADRAAEQRTARRAAALGAALAAATLARPNGAALAVLLAAFVVWRLARRPSRRELLRPIAVGAVAFVVPVGAWVGYSATRLHAVVPITTQGGSVLAGWYSPKMLDRSKPTWGTWDYPLVIAAYFHAPDELTWSDRLEARGRHWIASHPTGALRLVGMHVQRYFDLYWEMDGRAAVKIPTPWRKLNALTVLSWWAACGFAVAGAVRVVRDGQGRRWAPSAIAFAALAASGVLLAAGTRYRAPAEPVVLLVAAVPLAARWDRWAAPRAVAAK